MSHAGRSATDARAGRRRPPRLLVVGIVALAVFALFAFLVSLAPTHPFVQPLDDAWRRLVGSGHGPETAPLPMFFQYLGEIPGAILTTLVIPIVLLIARRWRSALFFLAAGLGSVLVAQVTKNLVNRPRPAADLANGLFGPLFTVDHGSFPSGHCVTVGFIAVAVAAIIPPARRAARRIWWIIGVLLAIGMVWQRTLINAHWFTDTLAGLVAGAAAALIIWWAFSLLLAKDYGRPFRRIPAEQKTD